MQSSDVFALATASVFINHKQRTIKHKKSKGVPLPFLIAYFLNPKGGGEFSLISFTSLLTHRLVLVFMDASDWAFMRALI